MGSRLFQTPGEILSRKPGAKSCGFLVVDFWLHCGSQSQLPAEPGTGAVRRDSVTNPAYKRASPRYFGSCPPTSRLLYQEYTHIRQAGGWQQPLLSLTAEQQKEESHPFFSFSLRACCLTKPLVTLDFSSSFCTKCSIITK